MDNQEGYFTAANAVAYRKISDYCRYQPRTHQQVRQKLYGWKLRKNVVEALLSALIEGQLVSESRFANAYAHDRFRINGWGKTKVRHALQKRQVSSYCIQEALTQVDASKYEAALHRLAERKWAALQGRGLHPAVRAKRTADFLLAKGYEASAVWPTISELQHPKNSGDDG